MTSCCCISLGSDCGLVSPVLLALPTPAADTPAAILFIVIWSDSLILDCCSDGDDLLDTLLATPLVVTPLDIILVLVLMAKVLLEGSDELTDMACMLAVEDWWLSDILELIQ